jgi:hypothetical protein
MEGVERGRAGDAAAFWTIVYWTFVTLLAPTAFAIRVQVSVLLMIWMLVRSAPLILSDARVRLEEHAHPSHAASST